jgi:hypothetical protein
MEPNELVLGAKENCHETKLITKVEDERSVCGGAA